MMNLIVQYVLVLSALFTAVNSFYFQANWVTKPAPKPNKTHKSTLEVPLAADYASPQFFAGTTAHRKQYHRSASAMPAQEPKAQLEGYRRSASAIPSRNNSSATTLYNGDRDRGLMGVQKHSSSRLGPKERPEPMASQWKESSKVAKVKYAVFVVLQKMLELFSRSQRNVRQHMMMRCVQPI